MENNLYYKRYLEKVKDWAGYLEFVPIELVTPEMCEQAVNYGGFMLKYVPKEFKTLKMCENALERDGYNLEFVPKDMRTFEICNKAIFTILHDEWDDDWDESFEGFFERNVPEEFHKDLAEKYDIKLPNKSVDRGR